MNVKLVPILTDLIEAVKSLDEGQKKLDTLCAKKPECERLYPSCRLTSQNIRARWRSTIYG